MSRLAKRVEALDRSAGGKVHVTFVPSGISAEEAEQFLEAERAKVGPRDTRVIFRNTDQTRPKGTFNEQN